ncbi:hypothetical protein RRG08_039868 [Elysia crispata]|uniref:Uncharacterized protein n=1 Tax=Elysia crispata TaxID=231223 RepID=A0AAE1DMQ4_9GAST|nr:hypothetical protein RRG08_039868 [Elysia crispata]
MTQVLHNRQVALFQDADGGDSDTEAGVSAADSQSGEYVSDDISDSETASSKNPVDKINAFSLENEDFSSTDEVLRLLREGSDGLSRISRGS